jgi:hypothetical protein
MENKRDIDKIIEAVKTQFPNVGVWQLEVKNQHDDNGIWYFWLGESTDDEIHVENSYGQCPFLLETYRNDERVWGNSVEKTVEIICDHLKTSKYNK